MYSPVVTEHFAPPRGAGALAYAGAVGNGGVPGQGNYVVLYLRVEGDRITDSGFETYGCPGTIASGSFVAEWVAGKRLAEAAALTVEELTDLLGGMPLGKEHRPRLAMEAPRDALAKLPFGTGGHR